MKCLLPALAVVVLAATLSSGCKRSEAPPVAPAAGSLPPIGPARAATIPQPIEKTLANGLRVIVLPRVGSSLVAAEFVVLSGGEVDPEGRAGLADFTANLLTKGSKSANGARSAPQLAAAAEALGGPFRAQAGWDSSRVGITVTTPKLAAALDLLAEVVRYPAFAADEVERLRAQTLDGLRLSLSDPGELAPLVAARLVHGAAPYGHPRLGTLRSVASISVVELRALHARNYRPDNAALILAGDLDPETGLALAAQIFGDWTVPKAATSAAPANPDEAASAATPAKPADVLIIDLPDAGQAAVVAAAPLPSRAADDYYSGLVTRAVLGGGYSSRLNREIRIKRGLSYGASAEYSVLRNGGALFASAQTKNESAAEVAALMRSELARLSTEDVPGDELAARKASYNGGYARTLETAGGLASLVAGQLAKGVAADEISRVIDSVDAVTTAQVRSYARQRLPASTLRMVIVGDAKLFKEALSKQGLSVETMTADDLDLDQPGLRKPLAR